MAACEETGHFQRIFTTSHFIIRASYPKPHYVHSVLHPVPFEDFMMNSCNILQLTVYKGVWICAGC